MTDLERLAIAYVKARGTKNGPAHYRKLEAYVNKLLAPHRYPEEQPQQETERRAA